MVTEWEGSAQELRAGKDHLRGKCTALDEERATARSKAAEAQEWKGSWAPAADEQTRKLRAGEEARQPERAFPEEGRAALAVKGSGRGSCAPRRSTCAGSAPP